MKNDSGIGLKVVSLVNGRLVGKDHLELSGFCQVMLTLWRTLKDIHY
jgi:hypothetical protein